MDEKPLKGILAIRNILASVSLSGLLAGATMTITGVASPGISMAQSGCGSGCASCGAAPPPTPPEPEPEPPPEPEPTPPPTPEPEPEPTPPPTPEPEPTPPPAPEPTPPPTPDDPSEGRGFDSGQLRSHLGGVFIDGTDPTTDPAKKVGSAQSHVVAPFIPSVGPIGWTALVNLNGFEQNLVPPKEKTWEERQYEKEIKWFGLEVAGLRREGRLLGTEARDLSDKKTDLTSKKSFYEEHKTYLQDKLKKLDADLEKARAELEKIKKEYREKLDKLKGETHTDRLKEVAEEIRRKYAEKYGEDWRDNEDLVHQASNEISEAVDKANAEWKKEVSALEKEAADAISKAEKKVGRAENEAGHTKGNITTTDNLIEQTGEELTKTETALKKNDAATKKNEQRLKKIARQRQAEIDRQKAEQRRLQKKQEREAAKRKKAKKPAASASGGQASERISLGQIRRAEKKIAAMKIFHEMFEWEDGTRIGSASGYDGSTSFSGNVDKLGKALELGKNIYVDGLAKGLAGKASPAGDVAGTLRDSLDAIGEMYNTTSQAFSLGSNLGEGRFGGSYRFMTSFDDAAEKAGVQFDTTRERDIVEKMVRSMAR